MQKELLKRVEMAFDEFSSALVCGIYIFFCFYFHLSVLRLYKFILFYIFFRFEIFDTIYIREDKW